MLEGEKKEEIKQGEKMILELDFPKIDLDFRSSYLLSHYKENVRELLSRILPEEIFFEKDVTKKCYSYCKEALPIVKWSKIKKAPCRLSVSLLSYHRPNVANFFCDMIRRWLILDKHLNIELFFSADFYFLEQEKEKFVIAEIVVKLASKEDIEEVKNNFKNIETEIKLGATSDYHANRILEFKGLANDKKIAMIQEKIGSLIRSRSKDFGQSIFSHMQHFLVTCRDDFKKARDYHHISRIISILYVMEKILKQKIQAFSQKRHLILKFLKTRLYSPERERSVLGVLVGLNFLKEHEVFEKNHLIKSIQHFIPQTISVENSCIVEKNRKENLQTIYLEIEKKDGINFSFEEIKQLRSILPSYLKDHVEHLVHPVFMPRNEEEIVRNIMTLSRQLRYVHDIPQMIISFDKQSDKILSFTIIFLRIVRNTSPSLEEIFSHITTSLKFIPERVKRIGVLRRKHIKEANVFRIELEKEKYLRQDHSVDLNKARQDILSEINRIFGEVRDYNGGMMYKQNEMYCSLKTSLGSIGKQHEHILEKFFYSITPVEMTVISQESYLKNLFLMLLNAIKREETRIKKYSDWLFKQDVKGVFVIVPIYNSMRKKYLKDKLGELNIFSSENLSFDLNIHDKTYFGYIYFSEDKDKQKNFIKIMQEILSS